jgi:hypothetical protein
MFEKWEGYNLLQTVEVTKRAMVSILVVDVVSVSMVLVWHFEEHKATENLMVLVVADLSMEYCHVKDYRCCCCW